MANGVFRDSRGWVMVDYGITFTPIPRATYESKGYQPPFETLPTEMEFTSKQLVDKPK